MNAQNLEGVQSSNDDEIKSLSHFTNTNPLTSHGMKIVKREMFNPNVMNALLRHNGISADEKKKMSQYFKNRINGNWVEVKYDYPKGYKEKGDGRVYAEKGLSLQMFPCDIRNALAKDYYWDVDMKNAHPTILLKICKENSWNVPCLERYVNERSEVLDEVGHHYGKSLVDSKQVVNMLMYLGGMPLKTSPEEEEYTYLFDLCTEFKAIARNLKAVYEEVYKSVSKRKTTDFEKLKSNVSFVLTNEEHKILMCMNDFLENNGRNVDTLIYDGCLVRKKKGEEEMDSGVLKACEKHIKRTMGYDITLAVKPMVSTLVLTDEGSEEAKARKEKKEKEATYFELNCYEKVKERFESKCFKVKKPVCYCEETDVELVIKPPEKFRETYRNLYFIKRHEVRDEHGCPIFDVDGDEVYIYENKKFIEKWFDDAENRTYERMDTFPRPLECPEGVYNTWNGFAVERSYAPSSGKVQPFLDHIGIMVNHDEKGLDYTLKWLASLIQFPAKLQGTAPVFYGEQGTGKSILFEELMPRLLGDDKVFSTCCPSTDLWGKHSNGRFGKFLINIDETKAKESCANSDDMKRAITARTHTHEPKGVDQITVRNFNRFAFTTNNENSIKVENTDRRYWVQTTSSEKIGDRMYFDMFMEYINDECNIKAIYEYLLTIDVSNVNWSIDRPMTERYRDMKALYVDIVYQMLINIVHIVSQHQGSGYEIGGKMFYEIFCAWCENNKHGKKGKDEFEPPFSSQLFYMKLKGLMEVDRECGISKMEKNGNRVFYNLDIAKLEAFFMKRNLFGLDFAFNEDRFLDLGGIF